MLKNIIKTYKSFIDLKLLSICSFLFSFYISLLNLIKLINIKIFGSIFCYFQIINNKLNIQLLSLRRILVYYLNNIIIFYIFINIKRNIKKYTNKYFIKFLFIKSIIKFSIILILLLLIKLIISVYFINSLYILFEYYENYTYYNYSESLENRIISLCLSVDYMLLKYTDKTEIEDDLLDDDGF